MMSTPSGRVVADYEGTFCWLIELFDPTVHVIEGVACQNSLNFYVKSHMDHDCVSTNVAWEAERFPTKEEAESVASRLLSKLGVWRATEHGFFGG